MINCLKNRQNNIAVPVNAIVFRSENVNKPAEGKEYLVFCGKDINHNGYNIVTIKDPNDAELYWCTDPQYLFIEKTNDGYIANSFFSGLVVSKEHDKQHIVIDAEEFENVLIEK
ncbi:MAG: hypothetical protein IJL97_06010, partial [Lachnospiraceae bacterium]|nr:hypothetical protein [Lachnospiraceae bacterium]